MSEDPTKVGTVCPVCGGAFNPSSPLGDAVFCICGTVFDPVTRRIVGKGPALGENPFAKVALTSLRDTPESILLEAETIVNGKRATDYGDSNENIRDIAEIATLLGQPIDGKGVCRVMMAVKLAREKFNHKRDNLVDLAGYAELLNRWEESR